MMTQHSQEAQRKKEMKQEFMKELERQLEEEIRAKREELERKLAEAHAKIKEKEDVKLIVTCDICGIAVARRNLTKHKKKVHRIYEDPLREKAARLRDALQENSLGQGEQIRDYLKRYPSEEGIGKFGVPQDKYRYGCYGGRTMEYDIWRKGDKR